jgi:adenylate cyclase
MAERTADERWREALMGIPPEHLAYRRMFQRLPSSPRCKNCAAPFAGAGAAIARALGFEPWTHNPTFCGRCLGSIAERGLGGAEVELSLLFADIRGSTTIAEGMSASAFAALLERFYRAATDALVRHDAMIDKFVGDEVVALFIPAFAGAIHARQAIAGARDLLASTGHGSPEGPWVPLGVGVHTGTAYVGAVGAAGNVVDITALGDAVNTAARLASAAATGEIIVSEESAGAADVAVDLLEHRSLDLKGKSGPVPVMVLKA